MDIYVPNKVVTIANVVALVALPEVQNYIANRVGLFHELAAAGKRGGERLKQDQFGNLLKGAAVVVPAAASPAPDQTEAA
jgi:hypothetical protein